MISRIAVALDTADRWHERFAQALTVAREREAFFEFEVVNLDRHDWITQLAQFDAVLWKSSAMGIRAAARWKEKIYFTETYLQKLVFPSFRTIWHFESKIAQSFVFEREGVPTPRTFTSSDYVDAVAAIEQWSPPFVFKLSEGAASSNVWKVDTREEARLIIEKTFASQVWRRAVESARSTADRVVIAARNLNKAWLWHQVSSRALRLERWRLPWSTVYWQEFIPDNAADLRITVIGGRYAAHYWRRNRPNDFRASGSGLIDYDQPAPEAVVRASIELARKLNYDTMAFDILFRDQQYQFVEMSYGYIPDLVAKVPELFELTDGTLRRIAGYRWPQELWVESLLTKLRST